MNNKVWIIGAGPGDPELITVKGLRLIKEADIIVYAGSLINKEILSHAKTDSEKHDSASMHLKEITDVLITGALAGKKVVRVHCGDPSLYGALTEQIIQLNDAGVEYGIVPGVSSAFASAAALGQELTLPEITQTVIFTRREGRTPVPPSEKLEELAKHGSTLCIFLSITMIDDVIQDLQKELPKNTPVAVVYRASWPEERILRGDLDTIADKVRDNGLKSTSMIIVGQVLDKTIKDKAAHSKLYCKEFEHDFRGATKK